MGGLTAAGVVLELVEDGRDLEPSPVLGGAHADAAREQYQKVHARFATDPGRLDLPGARILRQRGREVEVMVNGNAARVMEQLRPRSPEALAIEALTLEEIFVSTLQPQEAGA